MSYEVVLSSVVQNYLIQPFNYSINSLKRNQSVITKVALTAIAVAVASYCVYRCLKFLLIRYLKSQLKNSMGNIGKALEEDQRKQQETIEEVKNKQQRDKQIITTDLEEI